MFLFVWGSGEYILILKEVSFMSICILKFKWFWSLLVQIVVLQLWQLTGARTNAHFFWSVPNVQNAIVHWNERICTPLWNDSVIKVRFCWFEFLEFRCWFYWIQYFLVEGQLCFNHKFLNEMSYSETISLLGWSMYFRVLKWSIIILK